MARRAGVLFVRSLVIIACFQIAGCAGTPADFNSVVLALSARQVTAGGMVTIKATVPKDTTNAGVTWVFTPGVGAPANPGTFVSTTTQGSYTAPPNVPSAFTVTITATSIAFPSESASVTIKIQPPQKLEVTTTTLPNGVVNIAYPATTLKASGGVTPYTWKVTLGILPAGLTLNSNGSITGSPTSPGTANFTVQVTDSEATAMTATASLSITVANLLNGNYAFELSGFNLQGAFVMAGSFTSDGNSKINGVVDVNSIQGTPKNQTFTGTYTIGSDNRGQLIFSSLTVPPTFDFALDATGVHGRLIEFDASGNRGSGELAQQSVSTCGSNTLSGTSGTDYVFGVTGTVSAVGGGTPGPMVIAGRFTAEVPPNSSTPGNIDTGEADANIPQSLTVNPMIPLSGTFQTTSQAARCTMTIEPPTLATETYDVYPVLGSSGIVTEAFIVETDLVSSTTPYLTVGKMIHQTGYPFPGNAEASLTGTSVGAVTGNITSNGGVTYIPDVAVASVTWSAGTTFSLSVVENQGGTPASGGPFNGNFLEADIYGRLQTNIVSPLGPTFYVIAPNEVLCIGANVNEPLFGIFEPQSGTPFAAASALNATFVEGTSAPAAAAEPDFSGFVTLLANTTETSGTITGTQDTSTSVANTTGQAVTGTYAGFVAATGAGNVGLTLPATFTGSFFAVSPAKIVMVSTTTVPADPNPVIVVLGDQTDSFGVN
ncbi:MAG: putative Ig domain-containing protein [Candidatus Acidiferrales bacterium]